MDHWQVFEYAEKLLAKLPETDKQKALKVIAELLNPETCWNHFLQTEQKVVPGHIHEDDLDDDDAVLEVPQGPLAQVKEDFNKSTGALFDFLLDVMAGKYLSDLQELATQNPNGALLKALQEADDPNSDTKPLELVKQLGLLTGQFDGHSKSVSVSTNAPAPSLLTSLAAGTSEGGDAEAEREAHWKTVQSERRRYVSFGIPKAWSKDQLLACFRSCGKVFGFSGALNTSHRLFCASSDLVTEEGSEPWIAPTAPPEVPWREALSFISNCASGPADFTMLFDGRMWEMRRLHELWLK